MAYWFGDGFDLYTAITDLAAGYWDANSGASTLISTGRFSGSRAIYPNTGFIFKTSGVNDAVHHFSVAYYINQALGGTTGVFIELWDGATAQCTVLFTGSGNILLLSGAFNGTTLATYTGAIPAANTWYQFEIEVVINNATGSFAVRKLGNTVNDFFLGSLNTRGGTANNYANKIRVGTGTNQQQWFDDFLWRSDAASLAWLGDIRCYTRMPLTDASIQFTRSGSTAPVTPYVVGGAGQTPSSTQSRYAIFVPPCDGTIGSVTLQLAAANSGNVKCTIFANSGTNSPGAILGSATTLNNLPIGASTFIFSPSISVTRGTTYWIGFASDTAAANSWQVTSGTGPVTVAAVSTTFGYSAFPTANVTGLSVSNALIFTANVTPTAAVNAPFVAEYQQDGAASYVYSSTVGQSDLYNLAPLSATPGSIVGVTTRAYMEKSDAGTRIAAVQLQSGAANVQASLVLNTVWGWAWRSDQVDPNTSAAWTATGVNNAQIGPVVTA